MAVLVGVVNWMPRELSILGGHDVQLGVPSASKDDVQLEQTELDWKPDIPLGCKALERKAKEMDPIENVQLGKMDVHR